MNAFDRVIGYDEEKKELLRLCDMLRNSERYKRLGAKMPKGLLPAGSWRKTGRTWTPWPPSWWRSGPFSTPT